jgi:DNA-binding transcriptional LysR family regulator
VEDKGMRRGELDVAIGPPPPRAAPVETAPISEDTVVAALPTGHPLAGRDAVALTDLAGEPWVVVSAGVPSRLRDVAFGAAAAAGFTPLVAQEARELDALVALVSAGLGVTLVPHSAARTVRPGVVFCPLADEPITFPLVALWRAGPMPPALRTFLGVLREVVAGDATTPLPSL